VPVEDVELPVLVDEEVGAVVDAVEVPVEVVEADVDTVVLTEEDTDPTLYVALVIAEAQSFGVPELALHSAV
jgi:hypothetical protein